MRLRAAMMPRTIKGELRRWGVGGPAPPTDYATPPLSYFVGWTRVTQMRCRRLLVGCQSGTIATARDSWSRMVPLPWLRAPGQQEAQASALPRQPAAM